MVALEKMQEVSHASRLFKRAIPGRDMESRTKLDQEMRKVYKELDQTLPSGLILIQMPVLLVLFRLESE